ncbi:ABC-type transport auxiliary lipoprotein family protein [Dongia deserti]|uniref:ABC-type transport auxiliary lipoprotein family protein n=1 Tax=Dongia deserti TaxID=2268030 RepID=UPI000E6478F0|nr:ABC-type transport auxiliary lipoprotein family protein [Dongia deserti]
MRQVRPLILLPILAVLSGCFGSAPPVPKEQYFRLVAEAPAQPASKKIPGGIEIIPFAGEGVMSERPLLFTADGGRKLEQRNYAYWTSAPPQMLRDQLVAYLRQADVSDRIVPSELRVESAYAVRGTIKRLEQLVGSSTGAVISLELAVLENSSDRLVLSKVYTAQKPTPGQNIDDAVAALNDGMDEIFAAFAGDLASAKF